MTSAEAVRRLRATANAQGAAPIARIGRDTLRLVLDELDRLTAQAARLVPEKTVREDLVETSKVLHWGRYVAAAECPGCDLSWMKCLSTRRPDKTTVRRRWECPKCKGRFTSYDKEEVKS